MAKRKPNGQKRRVEFRQNRTARRRDSDWTGQYARDADEVSDATRVESVRPKGELSRKRTIIVGDDEAPLSAGAEQRCGTVTVVHGLYCRVLDDAGVAYECTVRRVLRTLLISQRSAVTVGDRVWFSPVASTGTGNAGVIERVEPRRTLLSRRVRTGHDTHRESAGREHLIVANADQLLIVASAAQPALKPHLIDRYLVAAMKGGMRPVICVNKIDLIGGDSAAPVASEDAGSVGEILAEYERLGFICLRTCAISGVGVEALRALLRDRITVLSGQSGVGKSSLLNAVQPGLGLRTREVSQTNEKGRHTTTHAELFRLDFGGFVADTPGIRQFDIYRVEPGELEAYFVEFGPFISQCRFHSCSHRMEAGCAVKAAVERGEIGARRYASYLKLVAEAAAGSG